MCIIIVWLEDSFYKIDYCIVNFAPRILRSVVFYFLSSGSSFTLNHVPWICNLQFYVQVKSHMSQGPYVWTWLSLSFCSYLLCSYINVFCLYSHVQPFIQSYPFFKSFICNFVFHTLTLVTDLIHSIQLFCSLLHIRTSI